MLIKVQGVLVGLIDKGIYQAKLESVEPVTTVNGDAYRLNFRITGNGHHKDRKVNGMCGTQLHPESKLYKWLSAIKGMEFAPDEEVDLDQLIGRTCMISVTRKERDGRIYANVEDVTSDDEPF
jgi:hypothetical protein